MIAACLLTCGPGRAAETVRTARAFEELNRGRSDVVMIHADGGGPGQEENLAIASAHGFRTIHAPSSRVGQVVSFRAMFDECLERGDLMLWLENDWEMVRPLPQAELFEELDFIEQFRLFGARKMQKDGPRAMAGKHIIGTKIPIEWKALPDKPWEIARCHWGAGGTIVRPEALEPFAALPRMKDTITASVALLSARPTENYLWHIGATTTEGFFG